MSDKYLHRHDLTEEQWNVLAPILPGQRGQWGGVAKDNRCFMNAVLWILRTGAPWRDLPSEFGKWGSVHQRFRRWRDAGVWERILNALAKRPEFEWLMIDATHCKVHPHAAGAIGGNEGMGRTKGGSTQKIIWPWMRLVCRSEPLLRRAYELTVKKLFL